MEPTSPVTNSEQRKVLAGVAEKSEHSGIELGWRVLVNDMGCAGDNFPARIRETLQKAVDQEVKDGGTFGTGHEHHRTIDV